VAAHSPIRILVAADGLAADLLECRLSQDPAFMLVGRTAPELALACAQSTEPDFVVLPLRHDMPTDLLDSVPRVKVLSLERASGRAYLTQLLVDVTPDELAEALRLAVRGSCA
jgi:DNA-binding NarL/FixJ family response regulator